MNPEVELHPVSHSDVEVFFEYQRDPEATRRANFPARSHAEFINQWTQNILGDDTVLARTITVSGEIAGSVVAWWQEERRFMGYWLGSRYWGRGVGTRAVSDFLTLEKHRPLYADADIGNIASVRLLKRCGFQELEITAISGSSSVLLIMN